MCFSCQGQFPLSEAEIEFEKVLFVHCEKLLTNIFFFSYTELEIVPSIYSILIQCTFQSFKIALGIVFVCNYFQFIYIRSYTNMSFKKNRLESSRVKSLSFKI